MLFSCCCCLVTKLCPTLETPWTVTCSAQSVHVVLLARILEGVAISFSISTDFSDSLNSLASKAGILLICPWPISLCHHKLPFTRNVTLSLYFYTYILLLWIAPALCSRLRTGIISSEGDFACREGFLDTPVWCFQPNPLSQPCAFSHPHSG